MMVGGITGYKKIHDPSLKESNHPGSAGLLLVNLGAATGAVVH